MQVNQTINKVKKDVIRYIGKLKFTGGYKKKDLIERFNNFKKEDFCCFGKDGNTYLTLEEYYKNISKEKAKKEYDSDMFSLEFHRIEKEMGVHLLKCCSRCRDLFLEQAFKTKLYKEMFLSNKREVVERKYFTFNQAKRLCTMDFNGLKDNKLQKVIVKLIDYVRFTSDTLIYRNILLEGGYFKSVASPSASGLVPRDMWLISNLRYSLDEALEEKEKRRIA